MTLGLKVAFGFTAFCLWMSGLNIGVYLSDHNIANIVTGIAVGLVGIVCLVMNLHTHKLQTKTGSFEY
jgi:hypothetical protein